MVSWHLTEKWAQRKYTFKVPEGVNQIYFGLETLGNTQPNCEVYLDDVELTEKR